MAKSRFESSDCSSRKRSLEIKSCVKHNEDAVSASVSASGSASAAAGDDDVVEEAASLSTPAPAVKPVVVPAVAVVVDKVGSVPPRLLLGPRRRVGWNWIVQDCAESVKDRISVVDSTNLVMIGLFVAGCAFVDECLLTATMDIR